MADLDELAVLAKYPFLSEARRWVGEAGYTLGDLLEEPAYARSRARAVERVRGSLVDGFVEEVAVETAVAAEVELLSYPVARMLVAQVGDSYLTNRYAVAESKLVHYRLAHDEAGMLGRVAAQLGMRFETATDTSGRMRLPFLEYLRNAPTRETDWKLVNQRLAGGLVTLEADRAVRLVEEALRNRIVDELTGMERPGRAVVRAFESELAGLQAELARHHARFKQDEVGELRVEAFPPCMQQIWAGIQGHVNIPHMGRFAIVAFLHKLGMDSAKILDFFSAVPDFDASKSRYQIEHITGEIGGSTEYTPPNCQTMATYGICPLDDRDELCFKITHPLTYYRRKYRNLPRKPVKKPAEGGVPSEAPAHG